VLGLGRSPDFSCTGSAEHVESYGNQQQKWWQQKFLELVPLFKKMLQGT
jgi:hypothetical protein